MEGRTHPLERLHDRALSPSGQGHGEAARDATIIIRTKNEARSLGATLDAVFGQVIPPREVIVIDSGSRDATLEIASQYPVQVIRMGPDEWSYSRSLNRGAHVASGEFLICLSAHCPPVDRNWLANLLHHFEDTRVAAVWGPSLPPGSSRPESLPQRQEPGTYDVHSRLWGLNNANSALRRSLWEQIPFDENLPAAEDKAWGREAMARGYCIVHEPAAAVWHERHSALNAFHRSRAVMAGFAILFPELNHARSGPFRVLVRLMSDKLLADIRHGDVAQLWLDLRRTPCTLAAVVGSLVGILRGPARHPPHPQVDVGMIDPTAEQPRGAKAPAGGGTPS